MRAGDGLAGPLPREHAVDARRFERRTLRREACGDGIGAPGHDALAGCQRLTPEQIVRAAVMAGGELA